MSDEEKVVESKITDNVKVTVTDVDIKFISLVKLIVKASLATIPAMIIFACIIAMFFGLFKVLTG